jgi:DNA-binding beta-propeller fold protein YncE
MTPLPHSVKVSLLMMSLVITALGVIVPVFAFVGTQTETDLRFLEPGRAPTFDEALIALPIEYALHSTEYNDVIVLGDSTGRDCFNPRQFEELSGLKAYNLSQTGKVGPMGFYLVASTYLQHHPKPEAMFLCLSPFAFQLGAKQTSGLLASRFLANYGPEVPSIAPFYKSVSFFAKRGTTQTWRTVQLALGYPLADPRDLPMFGKRETNESYHECQRRLAEGRGHWVPVELRAPGWNIRPGWLGQRVTVNEEWDAAVKKLAELCEQHKVPLFVRLTPIRKDYKAANDYSEVVTWMNALRDDHHILVVDPVLDFWDSEWHWDALHLNGPGAKRFSSALHKQLKQSATTLKGHTKSVRSVAFRPDGKRIVSGSQDNSVKLWDATNGREILTLDGHQDVVRSVAFSPDGQRIVSGSWDVPPKVWDATTGQEIFTLGDENFVMCVGFSPDGKSIACGNGYWKLKLWDAASGAETLTLKGHNEAIVCLAFSPDGKRIVTGSHDRTLKVWDLTTGKDTHTFKGHTGSIRSVAFSPDGKKIASGSDDHTIRVWDAASGQETLTLKGHTDRVWSVAFSPNGKQILSGSNDTTLKWWDAKTGRETLTLKGHTGGVMCVAFSPDGKRIVSGSWDNTLQLWDVPSGAAGIR